MGQDEEMDTTPLAQPFFMIDKEKETGSRDEEKQDGEDSEKDEDPNCPLEEEEDGDSEVSVTRKASTRNGQAENGECTKRNGKNHSESEESSDEEDMEEDKEAPTTIKAIKHVPVSSTAPCQTMTS